MNSVSFERRDIRSVVLSAVGPMSEYLDGWALMCCHGDAVAHGQRRPAGAARGASLQRSGAERAGCPAVLGLAPASRDSLRARGALRSDRRDENVDERASRGAQALRSSALQRRTACGPLWPSLPSQWLGQSQSTSVAAAPAPAFGADIVAGNGCARGASMTQTTVPALRQVPSGAGDLWGAEEHSGRGCARSALRNHSHRACLNGAPEGRAVSCAMRPARAHRRAVGAFSARPPHQEPAPDWTCRDARQHQLGALGWHAVPVHGRVMEMP